MRVLWIGVAGFFGAIARYWLGGAIARARPEAFPWGTFAVNVIGSFALGFIFAVTVERLQVSATARTAVTVGFLGAFTTFSTFSLETMKLFEDGATGVALAYIASSVGAALLAIYGGSWLGRTL